MSINGTIHKNGKHRSFSAGQVISMVNNLGLLVVLLLEQLQQLTACHLVQYSRQGGPGPDLADIFPLGEDG